MSSACSGSNDIVTSDVGSLAMLQIARGQIPVQGDSVIYDRFNLVMDNIFVNIDPNSCCRTANYSYNENLSACISTPPTLFRSVKGKACTSFCIPSTSILGPQTPTPTPPPSVLFTTSFRIPDKSGRRSTTLTRAVGVSSLLRLFSSESVDRFSCLTASGSLDAVEQRMRSSWKSGWTDSSFEAEQSIASR